MSSASTEKAAAPASDPGHASNVASSLTIVRDTQPVCEHVSVCTCVERVRMEGEREKDTTILLMALK